MLSLFGFINHGQFRFFSRTNTLLIIVYLGTSTGSDDIVYHQYMLSRIGQCELAFLLLRLRNEPKSMLVTSRLTFVIGVSAFTTSPPVNTFK